MKYKAVIFDFDGTFVDTNSLIIASWKHLYNTVFGIDPDPEVVRLTMGEMLLDSMKRLFPDKDPLEMVNIYREYHTYIDKKTVSAFPGMVDLVGKLRDSFLRVGLCTSRFWTLTDHNRFEMNFTPYFDRIVSGEDTSVHKPDPTPLLLCCERLNVKPSEALYVGDGRFDVLGAKNAGMNCVIVGWSYAMTREMMKEYPPTYIAETVDDLFAICTQQ